MGTGGPGRGQANQGGLKLFAHGLGLGSIPKPTGDLTVGQSLKTLEWTMCSFCSGAERHGKMAGFCQVKAHLTLLLPMIKPVAG